MAILVLLIAIQISAPKGPPVQVPDDWPLMADLLPPDAREYAYTDKQSVVYGSKPLERYLHPGNQGNTTEGFRVCFSSRRKWKQLVLDFDSALKPDGYLLLSPKRLERVRLDDAQLPANWFSRAWFAMQGGLPMKHRCRYVSPDYKTTVWITKTDRSYVLEVRQHSLPLDPSAQPFMYAQAIP